MKCGKNLKKKKKKWDGIKNKLGIKFHSKSINDQKYLKARVREFDGVIKTNLQGNDVPKENMHYTCIACLTIDSVMKMNKKTIHRFIQRNANIEQRKYTDTKLMAKLKPDSDSE